MIFRTRFLFLFVFLVLILAPLKTHAQFEGVIHFRAYDPSAELNPDRQLNFSSNSDRIFLKSNNKYRVFSGMNADGFIVRNDLNDFVLLSGDSDALKVTRDEIDTLTNLLQRISGGVESDNQNFDWDGRVEMTGETRLLHGYRVEQVKVFEENRNNFVSVWLTEEITINWGILQDAWHQALANVIEVELPVEVIMNRNSFPLLIEYFKDGEMVSVVEASQVSERNVSNRYLDIPDGARMLGLADIMMRMMRGQR